MTPVTILMSTVSLIFRIFGLGGLYDAQKLFDYGQGAEKDIAGSDGRFVLDPVVSKLVY